MMRGLSSEKTHIFYMTPKIIFYKDSFKKDKAWSLIAGVVWVVNRIKPDKTNI